LKAIRRELGDPKVKEHRGRIVKTTGDGLLIEFASVVDAVRCAVEVQQSMAERNAHVPEARRIEFRMGINLGDIIRDGVIFTATVSTSRLDWKRWQSPARFAFLARFATISATASLMPSRTWGERSVKNIVRPVRVYALHPEGTAGSPTPARRPSRQVRRLSPHVWRSLCCLSPTSATTRSSNISRTGSPRMLRPISRSSRACW